MTDISAIATLIANDQIRALLVEYAQCADTGRTDRLLELFAPDAVLEATNEPACHGRDELRAFFARVGRSAQTLMDRPYMRHHVSSIHVELDSPVEARSTTYFLAITDTGPDNWGRYRDTLRHDGESWTIHHRRLQLEGFTPGGWMDRHAAARGIGGSA